MVPPALSGTPGHRGAPASVVRLGTRASAEIPGRRVTPGHAATLAFVVRPASLAHQELPGRSATPATPERPASVAPPALLATPGHRVAPAFVVRPASLVHQELPGRSATPGHAGETGVRGATGLVGDTGPQGKTGAAGVVGARGDTGAAGAAGGGWVLGPSRWVTSICTGRFAVDLVRLWTTWQANGSRPGELSASGVTWVNNGYLGKTLSFDGTGRVESAEDAAFFDTDFAFEAFIICDNFAAQTRNAILSMNLDPTFLRVSSTGYLVVELPFDGGTGKVGFTGATALQTGRLYHVALSVSVTDQTMLLYLDGVQDGVLTSTEMMTLQDRTLYVGYDFNYASSHFKGIIDEVRFYDRPLTAAEVLAHSRQVYLTGEQGVVGATGGAGRTAAARRHRSGGTGR